MLAIGMLFMMGYHYFVSFINDSQAVPGFIWWNLGKNLQLSSRFSIKWEKQSLMEK